ncbi:uncharacterized protein LOC118464286 isoform X2 [Anopheles albimanus]|uniref:uncharacterized protein LOC118464286 isoform X2 n=1 Tax=Anopheles albimanus TaxID=7167 RepID=UPI00163FA352|nr:uncharacterized protein LOC118464286 isoform X2 [Anopheles albimanus]
MEKFMCLLVLVVIVNEAHALPTRYSPVSTAAVNNVMQTLTHGTRDRYRRQIYYQTTEPVLRRDQLLTNRPLVSVQIVSENQVARGDLLIAGDDQVED